MTITEIKTAAKTIRRALKVELGLTGREVSVTSGEEVVRVALKDTRAASLEEVREVAKREERIVRDERGMIVHGEGLPVFVHLA